MEKPAAETPTHEKHERAVTAAAAAGLTMTSIDRIRPNLKGPLSRS